MWRSPASGPDDTAPKPQSWPSINPYSTHMEIRNNLIGSLHLNTPDDHQDHSASASSSPSTSTPNMERLSLNASPLPTRASLLQQASYDPPYWLDNAAFEHGQSTSWSLPWPAVVPWFEIHPRVRVAAKADPFIAAYIEYYDDKYKHKRERLSLLSHASDHDSSSSHPASSANQPSIQNAVAWSQRLVIEATPVGHYHMAAWPPESGTEPPCINPMLSRESAKRNPVPADYVEAPDNVEHIHEHIQPSLPLQASPRQAGQSWSIQELSSS